MNKRFLNLCCGFRCHCKYSIENVVKSVVGIDLSKKILQEAKRINEYARKNNVIGNIIIKENRHLLN